MALGQTAVVECCGILRGSRIEALDKGFQQQIGIEWLVTLRVAHLLHGVQAAIVAECFCLGTLTSKTA